MSRIEIPFAEYTAMKKKITSLEKAVGDVSNEASMYKDKLGQIESLVMDLEGEGLVNRLFSWKKVIQPLIDIFKREDTEDDTKS